MAIYFLCPDYNIPSGGAKQIYRQVDILNHNGIYAAVLHNNPDGRQTWFEHDTKIQYIKDTKINIKSDYLVIPEVYGPKLSDIAKGVRKVVFNQNCYNTFKGYPLIGDSNCRPYLNSEVIAIITNSHDGKRYLQYAFPEKKIFRIRYGINQSYFCYQADKKQQIAFMPRKLPEDAAQIINILTHRNTLKDFKLIAINNQSESQVATNMRESLIFLSFNYCEGLGMPPIEAMACGCIVIGYPAIAGLEYLKPEFSYPVPDRDIIEFAATLEHVIDLSYNDPDFLHAQRRAAHDYVASEYSLANEEKDILNCWEKILTLNSPEKPRVYDTVPVSLDYINEEISSK